MSDDGAPHGEKTLWFSMLLGEQVVYSTSLLCCQRGVVYGGSVLLCIFTGVSVAFVVCAVLFRCFHCWWALLMCVGTISEAYNAAYFFRRGLFCQRAVFNRISVYGRSRKGVKVSQSTKKAQEYLRWRLLFIGMLSRPDFCLLAYLILNTRWSI